MQLYSLSKRHTECLVSCSRPCGVSIGVRVNATSVSPSQSALLQSAESQLLPPGALQRAQFVSSSSRWSANRCTTLPVVWNQGFLKPCVFLWNFILYCWILSALFTSTHTLPSISAIRATGRLMGFSASKQWAFKPPLLQEMCRIHHRPRSAYPATLQ